MTHGSALFVTGMLCVNMGQSQLNKTLVRTRVWAHAIFKYEGITIAGVQNFVT